jgi:hypothetical protein
VIDSEQVPWGKGEKQPGEGDEIVSETVRLLRAGAQPHLASLDVEFLINLINLIHLIRYQIPKCPVSNNVIW